MADVIEIRTGCRIHFGLIELAPGQPHRYGGLGLALQEPGYHLRVHPAAGRARVPAEPSGHGAERGTASANVPNAHQLAATDSENCCHEYHERIEKVRHILSVELGTRGLEEFEVNLLQALPLHTGLGAGTQLGVATAAGLLAALNSADPAADHSEAENWQPIRAIAGQAGLAELAAYSGRGKRSAIGLQAFLHGGLVADSGFSATAGSTKRSYACLGYMLPTAWRIVLIRPCIDAPISGQNESKLLNAIGQRPNPNAAAMLAVADAIGQCLRAEEPDFGRFTGLLDDYMDMAAKLFVEVQGGKFNGFAITQAAEFAQRLGLQAVGQSSWGPTVFGFAPDAVRAQKIVDEMLGSKMSQGWEVRVTRPARHGAQWRRMPST